MTKTTLNSTTTLTAPMSMQPASRFATFPIVGMRLLDGETPEQIAAREAAAATAEAERVAAATAEAERVAAEAAAAAEKKQLEDDRKAGKLTDKEFEFLSDAMKHKAAAKQAQTDLAAATAKLKDFDGIDPAKIKALIKAEDDAKTAAKAAELKAAEAAGDVEKIKKAMAEAHNEQVTLITKERDTFKTQLDGAQKTIDDLTVGAAFTQSGYVGEDLVLTPAIARTVFGPHFDVVDGKITPYDKPRGATGRGPMLDVNGAPLAFEAAVKKLVEASPDRDKLVRSKLAPGAQSRSDAKPGADDIAATAGTGIDRIRAALNANVLGLAK